MQDPHPRIHGDSYPDDASQNVEAVKIDEDYRSDILHDIQRELDVPR